MRILVDSGADYLPEEMAEKGIEMAPLQILIGEENYLDTVELSRAEFYEKLTSGEVYPKTSQPSPAVFLEIFEDVKAKGEEMVCVLLASALSGTYQSAATARELVDYDGIYLVDSRSACMGIRLLADRACERREQGVAAAEIVRELEELRSRVRIFFMVDTLEYLYRGGRLSRTAAMVGKLVNMKPVLTVDPEGKVAVADVCLGAFRAIETTARHLKKQKPSPEFPLYVVYSHGLKNCEALEAKVEKLAPPNLCRKQIGSVIGSHLGPGATGLIYIEE